MPLTSGKARRAAGVGVRDHSIWMGVGCIMFGESLPEQHAQHDEDDAGRTPGPSRERLVVQIGIHSDMTPTYCCRKVMTL